MQIVANRLVRRPRRVQAAAEVGDSAWPIGLGPVLGPQRLRHRRPGFEWSQVGADSRTRVMPAELGFGWPQPDLECLGGHGPHLRGHLPPFGPVGDQFGGEHRNDAHRDGKHHMVEVDAPAQDTGFGIGPPTEVRFRVAVRHRRELLGQWPIGEHRQSPDRRQWFVVFDRRRTGGPAGRSVMVSTALPVSVQMQAVDAVEELESDTAPAQYLIQRRDHDVTHPRRHLPEQRTPVSEQHVTDQEDHHPGGHRGSFGIGVLIAEHQVVQAAHHRRIQHIGMAAVAQHPVAELFVVERPEAAGTGHHVVGDDAAHRGGHQRQQHPRAAVARAGSRSRSRREWRPACGRGHRRCTTDSVHGHQCGEQGAANGGDRLIRPGARRIRGSGQVQARSRCRRTASR